MASRVPIYAPTPLVAGDLPGLSAGVYHFGPHDFALRRLRDGDYRAALVEASGRSPDLVRSPVISPLACSRTSRGSLPRVQARPLTAKTPRPPRGA